MGKKPKILLSILIIIILICVGLLIYLNKFRTEEAPSKDGLFTYTGILDPKKLDDTAVSGYKIKINIDQLRNNDTIELNLPGPITYTVIKDHTDPELLVDTFSDPAGKTRIVNDFIWFGKTVQPDGKVGLGGDVLFNVSEGKYVTATIHTFLSDRYMYDIRHLNDSEHMLQKIDQRRFGED